jgi:hypothetical protein
MYRVAERKRAQPVTTPRDSRGGDSSSADFTLPGDEPASALVLLSATTFASGLDAASPCLRVKPIGEPVAVARHSRHRQIFASHPEKLAIHVT